MSPPRSGPPPLRRMIVPALFVGGLFLVVFLRQPNGPNTRDQWVLTGATMGTTFTVKAVIPQGFGSSRGEIESVIRDAVDGVDALMSNYRPESELSRFNRHGDDPMDVSESLLDVVSEARRVSEISGGAFDITVGPLVDAWGFGPTPVAEVPGDSEIEALLADNGYRHLEIDRERGTLRKARAGLRCDLSAIAKGYAVDRVCTRLGEIGLRDFMVEIGGEVRAAGFNSTGEVWRIGVERPEAGRGGVWSAVELNEAAMATSGDYRNYYEREGVRISHTIDARTGRPITHALASVTVIHPTCMTADALATALNVLGPDDGRALAQRENLAVLFLLRNPEGGFDEWASDTWPGENSLGAADVDHGESG